MDDQDNTRPELPALLLGSAQVLPEKTMPERAGRAVEPAHSGAPESGYDPYNSAA
jgi:hypothetical protein